MKTQSTASISGNRYKRNNISSTLLLCALLLCLLGASAAKSSAQAITYDGNLTETGYNTLGTQTVGSCFGAGHEVNALKASNNANYLNLAVAGNVQNGNRILVFIDSRAGGYNTADFGRFLAPQGIDDFNSVTTFDSTFAPDYVLVIGTNVAGTTYFADLYTLSGTVGSGGGPNNFLGSAVPGIAGNAPTEFGANPANNNSNRGFEVGLTYSTSGAATDIAIDGNGVKLFAAYVSDGGFLAQQFITPAGAAQGCYGGGAVNFNNEPPNPVVYGLNGGLAFDAAGQACSFDQTGLPRTFTWQHTIGNGSNRLLVVGVSTSLNLLPLGGLPPPRVLSVTYNSVALTRVDDSMATSPVPDTRSAVEMFRLTEPLPTTGTYTVQVTLSAGVDYAVGGSASFANANQLTPTGAFQRAGGTNTTPTVNVPSAANEVVMDTVAATFNGNVLRANAAQTERWNGQVCNAQTSSIGAGSTKQGSSAPLTNMAWTQLSTQPVGTSLPWAIGAVSIKPCTPLNFALASAGATATASSTYPNPGFPASSAIDGEHRGLNWGTNGGWNDATRGVHPDWLQVDFNGSKTINEIRVYTIQNQFNSPVEPTLTTPADLYGLLDFQVQTWDGTQWATVPGGVVTGNDKAMRVITFPSTTTTKIRIFVTNTRSYFSRIAEVEAFGCPLP